MKISNIWRLLRILLIFSRKPSKIKAKEIAQDIEISDFVSECIWHPSQKLSKNKDGSLTAEFEIEGLSEIKIWVLGFGANVEVLEPKKLRDELKEIAAKIQKIYNNKL